MNRFFLLSALIVAGTLAGAVPAVSDVGINFIPPDSTVIADSLTVLLTVDDQATDLRGFSMVLDFDPAVVTPLAVEPGSLLVNSGCPYFLNWLNPVAYGDSLLIDGASLGCSVVGPGDLVRIRFQCASIDTGTISCRSVDLRDSVNQPVASTCGSAELRCVQPPISVEGTTWGRVKSWYGDLRRSR